MKNAFYILSQNLPRSPRDMFHIPEFRECLVQNQSTSISADICNKLNIKCWGANKIMIHFSNFMML